MKSNGAFILKKTKMASIYGICESVVILIVIYIISGIKAILQDSSVKTADDEGVSPSSSVTHEFPVICFSPCVMYNILSTAANY
jgi:hypothetical protein